MSDNLTALEKKRLQDIEYAKEDAIKQKEDYDKLNKVLQKEKQEYVAEAGGEWFAKRKAMEYWKKVFTDMGKGLKPTLPSESGIPFLVLKTYNPKLHKQQYWFQQGYESRPAEEKAEIEKQVEESLKNQEIVDEYKRIASMEREIDRKTAGLVPPEIHKNLTDEQKEKLYERACEQKVIIKPDWDGQIFDPMKPKQKL